jgi:hypothetical protein
MVRERHKTVLPERPSGRLADVMEQSCRPQHKVYSVVLTVDCVLKNLKRVLPVVLVVVARRDLHVQRFKSGFEVAKDTLLLQLSQLCHRVRGKQQLFQRGSHTDNVPPFEEESQSAS